MNRVQKKCLFGAAGCHLLLLAVLFVGPAFPASAPKPDDGSAIILTKIPEALDATVQQPHSDGNVQPQIAVPVHLTQPVAAPETEAVAEPVERFANTTPQDATAGQKIKPGIEVEHQVVHLSRVHEASPVSNEPSHQPERKNPWKVRVGQIADDLGRNLSTDTGISLPSRNPVVFSEYGDAVRIKYTDAWIPPSDITDENAIVKVSVVIARDGSVVTAKVIGPSGADTVDRSVEQTLRRVKFIAPFPDGATDDQRTFIINFNLKAKRLNG